MVYFAVHKPFSLMGPTCLFLLLFVLCFHIEEIAGKTNNKRFIFFFPVPSKNLKVSDPLWVNFHDWRETGVQFHPFAYGYSIFPTTFIEKTIHSPTENACLPCQILIDQMCEDLFLGCHFCSIGQCVSISESIILFWLL